MLNNARRIDLRFYDNGLRSGGLRSLADRKAHVLYRPDAPRLRATDEATPSQATKERSAAVLSAMRSDHDFDPAELVNDVVASWRADNAAGGHNVIDHTPLPNDLAAALARLFGELPDEEKPLAFGNITSKLDPGAKSSVERQIAELIGRLGATVGASKSNEPGEAGLGRFMGDSSGPLLEELGIGEKRSLATQDANDERGGLRAFGHNLADAASLRPDTRLATSRFLDDAYAQSAVHEAARGGASLLRTLEDEERDGQPHVEEFRNTSGYAPRADQNPQSDWQRGQPQMRILPNTRKGQICRFGRCEEARHSLEIDDKVPPAIRRFEERVMRSRLGPFKTIDGLKQDPYFHQYYHTTRIRVPRHQWRNVQRMMQTLAGPQVEYGRRPLRTEPVRDGDTSPVTALGVPAGYVTHYVDPETGAVANVTMPGKHILDPGYVVRWVEYSGDGTFTIHTLGRGVGNFGAQNEIMGAQVFAVMDQAIAHKLGGEVMMW